MVEPFALQIYRRFLHGESVERLALALGIPADRVAQRIRAARMYYERRRRRVA